VPSTPADGGVAGSAAAGGAGPRGATGPPRWIVVQHAEHEGPGVLRDILAAHGAEVVDVLLHKGEPLPDLHGVRGVVSMGGPMGVHDTDAHPWLEDERRWLAASVVDGLPVLGVCLGAQQLAAALGARVRAGAELELGRGAVSLTSEGRRDPVLGPEGDTIDVIHWHGDTFDIPPGAERLATSDRCANQAFRLGPLVYGFQFHIEVDEPLLDSWRPEAPAEFVVSDADRRVVETAGRRVLGRFVAAVSGGSSGIAVHR
jgi:GMP synthase (glutamine-hydrolysing)